MLQEDYEIHSEFGRQLNNDKKQIPAVLCHTAQTDGANLVPHVKNPEKHLVLFSGFTWCDIEHGHHTDLLLVPKLETSTWEDPTFHAVMVMMTFERQFA